MSCTRSAAACRCSPVPRRHPPHPALAARGAVLARRRRVRAATRAGRGRPGAAARELFAELGYGGTTVRAIARRVGVDPALIHHFFVNKDGVFHAAVQSAVPLADLGATLLEGGSDGLAERLLRGYLMLWEGGERDEALAAIYRTALTHEAAQTQLDEIREKLMADLAATIGGRDAKQRAALIGAQLHGLAS